jgi:hypothetical protein
MATHGLSSCERCEHHAEPMAIHSLGFIAHQSRLVKVLYVYSLV